jgi:16S rRNA processing protein RimM
LKRKHLLRIGRVRKPHGVRGKVSVYLFNDQSACLKENLKILAGADEEAAWSAPHLTLEGMQEKRAGTVILAFREITTADEAAGLKNASLFVERREVGLEDDEILVDDLVGLEVRSENAAVGRVVRSYWTGACDVLVVETGDGLIDFPFCDDYLESVDLEGGILKVLHFADFSGLTYREGKGKKGKA